MTSLFALMIAAQALPAEIALASADTSTSAASEDRLVCRQRPVTGTRLRFTRVCMTAREWNERRENITRGIRDFTTREMASQPPPPITPGSQ
jgi:hypothetical protein